MFLPDLIKRSAFDPVLVCDPVYLRAARANDFEEWSTLREASREHLVAWEQGWAPDDMSRASFRRRRRAYAQVMKHKTSLPLLIFRREDDRMAGGITLTNIRYGAANTGTLGYWTGVHFARQGLATAAVTAILAHAFERIGLNRVEAACQPGNLASLRVLDKCGFQREGFARDYLKINGQWRDHAIFALTVADYRP